MVIFMKNVVSILIVTFFLAKRPKFFMGGKIRKNDEELEYFEKKRRPVQEATLHLRERRKYAVGSQPISYHLIKNC